MEKRATLLNLLLSEVRDLAYFCGRDGKIMYMNEPFQKLLAEGATGPGEPFAMLFPEKYRQKALMAVEKALQGELVEIKLPLGGASFAFRMKPFLESGKVMGFFGAGQAVLSRGHKESKLIQSRLEELVQERTAELIRTNELLLSEMLEREEAEKALIEAEKKYRSMLEAVNDAIFVADASTGIIIHANSKASELVGRPLEELIGLHQSQLHSEEDAEHYKAMFRERVRIGVPFDGGIQYVRHADGRKIPVRIGTTLATVENRLVIHGIFKDLSKKIDIKNS
ncbi:MAG: PAS domain S-box protein [Deltaproteobacteria bacterium]|nr:PAS domain S-box protein [Deltaproteobacteria bacterium]